MPKAALLQLSRKVHLYFGLIISPALVFFAITGAYQTLGLHEASSNYKPARLLAVLGQIHKKQTSTLPTRRPGAAPGPPAQPEAARAPAALTACSGQDRGSERGLELGPNQDKVSMQGDGTRTAPEKAGRETGQGGPVGNSSAAHPREASPAAGRDLSTASAGTAPGRPVVGNGQPQLTLEAKQRQHLPLKLFFVLVSLGLLTSTLTGIYMAYRYDRSPFVVTALLVLGTALPLILLRF